MVKFQLDSRLPLSVAIAVLIAIVVAGCGGGSEDATSASTISKAEFIKRANAACERERAGLAGRVSEFERRRAGRKPDAGADMVHLVYLPTMEAQGWRIEELTEEFGIPRGEAGRIDAMLDAGRFAVDRVAVEPKVSSIAVAERSFANADRLFRNYGLDACVTDHGQAVDNGA